MTNHLLTALVLAPACFGVGWLVWEASWFWNHRPDLHFGWIVLALSTFLVFDRWRMVPTPMFRFSARIGLLSGIGLSLLLFYQVYQATYGLVASGLLILSLGVVAVALSNLLFVYGPDCKTVFLFPLLFLFVALPIPSGIYNELVASLQSMIASITVEILNLLGIPARKVGYLIFLSGSTLGIDEACSGVRSLQSCLMAGCFISYFVLRSISSRILLVASAVSLAILGNVLRCLYLSLTANAKGASAVQGVHDAAGWSVLLLTVFGLGAIAWILVKLEKLVTIARGGPETNAP